MPGGASSGLLGATQREARRVAFDAYRSGKLLKQDGQDAQD